MDYDASFYRTLHATAHPSATKIVPLVLDLWPCKSVIDVGCGDGSWLAAFRTAGVYDVLGVDGPWVDPATLKIPTGRFRATDLNAPLDVSRDFDLAMSLEVAEHLAPERAESFVADLVSLAPVVLFSAAVPGQGGVGHINEQWPSYWADLFKHHSYGAVDALRPLLWQDESVAWWYRQNLLLFVSAAIIESQQKFVDLSSSGKGAPAALVHPELFSYVTRLARPRFGRWLRMMPAAFARSLERRSRF